MFENIFETVNSGFAQALYEDYLRDPSSVPEEWRKLFEKTTVATERTEATEASRESSPVRSVASTDPLVSAAPLSGPRRPSPSDQLAGGSLWMNTR